MTTPHKQESWEEEFIGKGFYRITNDNAPITDMISFIQPLLTQDRIQQREELVKSIKELKVKENMSSTWKKGYYRAMGHVLALLQEPGV